MFPEKPVLRAMIRRFHEPRGAVVDVDAVWDDVALVDVVRQRSGNLFHQRPALPFLGLLGDGVSGVGRLGGSVADPHRPRGPVDWVSDVGGSSAWERLQRRGIRRPGVLGVDTRTVASTGDLDAGGQVVDVVLVFDRGAFAGRGRRRDRRRGLVAPPAGIFGERRESPDVIVNLLDLVVVVAGGRGRRRRGRRGRRPPERCPALRSPRGGTGRGRSRMAFLFGVAAVKSQIPAGEGDVMDDDAVGERGGEGQTSLVHPEEGLGVPEGVEVGGVLQLEEGGQRQREHLTVFAGRQGHGHQVLLVQGGEQPQFRQKGVGALEADGRQAVRQPRHQRQPLVEQLLGRVHAGNVVLLGDGAEPALFQVAREVHILAPAVQTTQKVFAAAGLNLAHQNQRLPGGHHPRRSGGHRRSVAGTRGTRGRRAPADRRPRHPGNGVEVITMKKKKKNLRIRTLNKRTLNKIAPTF